MPNNNSKDSYFPPKPENAEGFKEPVSWLGGRELVASLKGMIMYSIYGENIDPRSWMKANIYPNVKEAAEEQYDQPTVSAKNESVRIQAAPETKVKIAGAVDEFWAKKVKDAWDWKKKYFNFWKEKLAGGEIPGINENGELEELWFDYIADSGDGQTGVYGVGCLELSDLWMTENKTGTDVTFHPEAGETELLLPRGSFLFVGGDTAYHVADYSTIHERFQNPLRWAFASVRKFLAVNYKLDLKNVSGTNTRGLGASLGPDGEIVQIGKNWSDWDGMLAEKERFWDTEPPRPLFGVPANHDYYDDIDGFNRQFRRPPFENLQENEIDKRYRGGFPLAIPSFQREQEASYIALRLPFNWWFLGIDSENEKLDFRQKIFFEQVMKNYGPKKLILATPEPTTVFGIKCNPQAKTSVYLDEITKSLGFKQPFLEGGDFVSASGKNVTGGSYCRLDLSGDVHHYARYWGPDTGGYQNKELSSDHYASLVAGGGGAFFDATGTLVGQTKIRQQAETVPGEIPPQITFPSPQAAKEATADRIFDLWNIRNGGYVQTAGLVIALILYYSLVYAPSVHDFFRLLKSSPLQSKASGLYAGLYLFLSAVMLFLSGYSLHNLITRLKNVRTGKSVENVKGEISELKKPFYFLLVGIAVYFLLFYLLQVSSKNVVFESFNSFGQSLLLLLHLIIGGLIVWISIEYTNWLPLRFKFFSTSNNLDDEWTSTTQKIDEVMDRQDNWLKRLWQGLQTKTVENFPTVFLNGLAVIFIILGVRHFGSQPLSQVGINLLLTLVTVSCFLGIIAFAYSTGAAYQTASGKRGFIFIGFCHAVLQILTPFVLVYYGRYWFVVGVILLTIVTNGAILSRLTQGKIPQLGAWLMKRCSANLLLIVWIFYGLLVIVPPFLLPKPPGTDELLISLIEKYTGYASEYLRIIIALLIAGYLGYRMSRVWFSWYLAVSLAFNGHNNEAGGAARIEGFKHILRIKVEPEKLTVYVIGFEKAQPELKDLKPKLVDRFELTCQNFPG